MVALTVISFEPLVPPPVVKLIPVLEVEPAGHVQEHVVLLPIRTVAGEHENVGEAQPPETCVYEGHEAGTTAPPSAPLGDCSATLISTDSKAENGPNDATAATKSANTLKKTRANNCFRTAVIRSIVAEPICRL